MAINIYTIIMAKCSPSTMVIGQPSLSAFQKCASTSSATMTKCGDLGPADCCDRNLLGPRDNRDRVRGQIKDFCLLMLGAPVLDLELDDQQVELAIDYALQIIEDYAPREFFNYYTFPTVPGQSVYELPPEVGHVRNVFYRTVAQYAFQASDLDGVIPIEYLYPGGSFAGAQGALINPTQPLWGEMGAWTLYKQYEQMFSRVSSQLGGWEWVGDTRHIKLYPVPCRPSHVIVHYLQRCKDWNCVMQSMQEGALCFCKIMLGRIRSKFQNIPGPSGGTILDGAQILQEGLQEKKEWEERLLTRFGDLPAITLG